MPRAAQSVIRWGTNSAECLVDEMAGGWAVSKVALKAVLMAGCSALTLVDLMALNLAAARVGMTDLPWVVK